MLLHKFLVSSPNIEPAEFLLLTGIHLPVCLNKNGMGGGGDKGVRMARDEVIDKQDMIVVAIVTSGTCHKVAQNHTIIILIT